MNSWKRQKDSIQLCPVCEDLLLLSLLMTVTLRTMESLVKENRLTAVCERAHRGSHVTEKVDLIRFLKLAQKMT